NLRIRVNAPMPDLIAPGNIVEGEVISFCLPKTIEGTVVNIKTVEGEVVETKKADKYGRVFLAAGLAAGTYLISRPGSINETPIQVGSGNNLSNPGNVQAMDDVFRVPINGNADHAVWSAAPNLKLPILAKSPRQAVIQAPADLGVTSGNQTLLVCDENDKTLSAVNITLYNLSGKLNRTKLMSGEAARIEFKLDPPDLKGDLTAMIVNGPVHFAGGQTQAVTLTNGQGSVSVQSTPGQTGPFQVGWQFRPGEVEIPEPDKDLYPWDPKNDKPGVPGKAGKSDIIVIKRGIGGTMTIVIIQLGEFVEGDPLERVEVTERLGDTKTDTEATRHKKTKKIISGKRKVTGKDGQTISNEVWNPDLNGGNGGWEPG
ncbi:MAG: hypothetical protein ABL962_18670, partial [Fimbriimonadaceae bacterium]